MLHIGKEETANFNRVKLGQKGQKITDLDQKFSQQLHQAGIGGDDCDKIQNSKYSPSFMRVLN